MEETQSRRRCCTWIHGYIDEWQIVRMEVEDSGVRWR
jgi:hypothetical protein